MSGNGSIRSGNAASPPGDVSRAHPELEIAAHGLHFPEGPVAAADGSLYFVEIQRGTVSRLDPRGAVSVVADLGGGPNGLAAGPGGALFVCNNGGFLFTDDGGINRVRPGVPDDYRGSWLERLDPGTGAHAVVADRCGEHAFVGLNDLVFDHHGGCYFTDFGKFYPRFRPNGGLYYARPDLPSVLEVAYPMITPNGVALAPDESVVYVAESETARLWAFDLVAPGRSAKRPYPSPHGGRIVFGLGGFNRFDSMAVDADGNLCIATLVGGCICVVSPRGELLDQVFTGDPMTTNLCFGGSDLSTAYVTLSGTGRIASLRWPVAGLPLAFAPGVADRAANVGMAPARR